jgi:hypothetical protein
MMPDLVATQNVTLAGFRLLDPNGIVIAGREEVGLSLAHLEEVAEALQGRFRGALRVRISKHDQPSLYSMSRGTGMRVFTAMPVIARDQVAGVIYASRTPSNVFKYLYEQRAKLSRNGEAAQCPLQLHLDLRHPCIPRAEVAADVDPGCRRAAARRRRRAGHG